MLADAIGAVVAVIEQTLPATVATITFAVEDVPSPVELRTARNSSPLGRSMRGNPSTVTVYRRPLEARCADATAMQRLVRDVLAELVGELAGVAPTRVCPDYRLE